MFVLCGLPQTYRYLYFKEQCMLAANFYIANKSKYLKGDSGPRVRHVFHPERSEPRVRHVFHSEHTGPRVRQSFPSERSGKKRLQKIVEIFF